MIDYVKLGGKVFEYEYYKSTGEPMYASESPYAISRISNYDGEIDLFYNRPSAVKRRIWLDWCAWASENHASIWLNGANCMTFSIVGYIVDDDGKCWNLYITKDHRRAYPVMQKSYFEG